MEADMIMNKNTFSNNDINTQCLYDVYKRFVLFVCEVVSVLDVKW